MTSPRLGIGRLRVNSTTITISSGSARPRPCSGSHDTSLGSSTVMPSRAPVAKPATAAIGNEANPATRATARAGRMNSVKLVGVSVVIVEKRTPKNPAITDARIQLAPARRSGDKPVRMAPFSFSADACVAQPMRVQRNSAQSSPASDEHHPGEDEAVEGDRLPEHLDGRLREDARNGPTLWTEAQQSDRLQREHHADRGDDLGQWR